MMSMKKHILIIDDEFDIAEALATVLATEGYSAEIASTGQLGFDAIDKRLPDLIILDVMMPRLKGPEVVRIIREEKKLTSIPIILISASHEPKAIDEKQWSIYMRKPFDLDEMLAHITKLLA
jgi:DNA-binding response OmpR family regulator